MAVSGAMSDLPDELPSDPAELRAFAAALLERCARLERLLKLAKDAQFGRSSEKLDADQLQLVLEDIDQAVAALEAAEDRANPKTRERRAAARRANRGQLPEHLPRIVNRPNRHDLHIRALRLSLVLTRIGSKPP
jgi:transposase